MKSPSLEIIASDNNLFGESPLWDAARGRLLWVDHVTGSIFEHQPGIGGSSVLARNLPANALAMNHDGRVVLAGAQGILIRDESGNLSPFLAAHGGRNLIFNDIVADARGNLYGGTFYWGDAGREHFGMLYLVRPDGTAEVMDEGIELSNGLGFSPDGRTLYFTDSIARKIFAYEMDRVSGILRNRRVFVTVPSDEGLPDGLTVDAEGFVWSAQWYGSQVVRYDPDGRVERRLKMPVQQVSSVMFGGPDLTDLYITSAGEAWPSDYAPPSFDSSGPMGGSLYRARLDIVGCREHCTGFTSAPHSSCP
jgi:D-xylonolactonase